MRDCPICRRAPADPKYRPFCSRRCADVDLQRWLGGVYAIPGEPVEEAPKDDGTRALDNAAHARYRPRSPRGTRAPG